MMRHMIICAGLAAFVSTPTIAQASDALGQRLMLRCQTCHAVKKGAPPKVGPNLNGMFGRKAGMVPGYDYSDAMRNSKIIWTEKSMDDWLKRPAAVTPGTSMAFVGLPKAEDRAALIAYLKKVTR
jgi:cytochrome c